VLFEGARQDVLPFREIGTSVALPRAALIFLIGHRISGLVIWGLALFILLLGLVAPRAYQPIHRIGKWLGRIIGNLLSYLMLVPLYLLVFTPASIYLKLKRRDPMQRQKRDPQHTYWIPRRLRSALGGYRRQFLLEDREARSLLRPVGPSSESRGTEQP